jgi:hypothetical protein
MSLLCIKVLLEYVESHCHVHILPFEGRPLWYRGDTEPVTMSRPLAAFDGSIGIVDRHMSLELIRAGEALPTSSKRARKGSFASI